MKFNQAEPEFRPLVITLESQEEVDAMYSILGKVASGETGLKVHEWYNALEDHVTARGDDPLIVAKVLSYGIGLEVR